MGEAELHEDGTSKVTINNLEPNTVYPEGTFRVAHVKNEKVSDYVDVPNLKRNQLLQTKTSTVIITVSFYLKKRS